jgi:hypothetical protein
MGLRKKPLRVLPNPWLHIDPDHGPQGRCHIDTRGKGTALAFVGAEFDPEKTKITEKRGDDPWKGDTRGDRQVTVLRYPALNAMLDGPSKECPEGIEIGSTPYYLDRLRDGDLVPADESTASQVPCRFKSLSEARAAGIAKWDAEKGEGVPTFAEGMPELAKATKAVDSGAGSGGASEPTSPLELSDKTKTGKGGSK